MSNLVKKYCIVVLPGDGIGREVIPEAVKVLKAVEEQVDLYFDFVEFPCGGEYYLKTGLEWPEEAWHACKNESDAILFGAVGWIRNGQPVRLPNGDLAGSNVIFTLRFGLDLYANVRPVKLYPGVPSDLTYKEARHIDFVFVRENTEGIYAPIRGVLSRGDEEELAVDVRVITRKGSERVIRYAFNLSVKRGKGAPLDKKLRVTCVDKSNLLRGCQLFRRTFEIVAKEFPQVEKDYIYVDTMAMQMIRIPEKFDVIVSPNMFGDILTDLGAALQGGLGMAPSGNIGDEHAMFEPVHGSSPDIAGQGKANPIAAILAAKMMLEWLSERHSDQKCKKAAEIIEKAVEKVLAGGKIRTFDLCYGPYSNIQPSKTSKVGDAIVEAIRSMENFEF